MVFSAFIFYRFIVRSLILPASNIVLHDSISGVCIILMDVFRCEYLDVYLFGT